MAEEKVSIVVSLKDNASKAVTSLQNGFEKLGNVAKVVAVAGIGVLTAFIKKSVDAFAEEEKAVTLLKASLKSTGQEVDKNAKSMLDFATEIQKTTTVADDQAISMMQMAISMGLNASQAKNATMAAIGLSKAFGVDMNGAMKAASAAQLGNYDLLKRMVPELRGITDQSVLAARAQEILGSAFQVAQAETKTFSGAMAQLKNAFGDAQEKVGSVFAPVIMKVAQILNGLVGWFNDLNPAMQKNVVIIGTITVAAVALIPVLGVLATAVAAISWPVLAVVAAVAALAAGFFILQNEIKSVGGITNFIKNSFLSLVQVYVAGIKTIMGAFNKFLQLLSKIPGVKLNINPAIAAMDELNAKLEESKVKRIEEAEQDKVREQENQMAYNQTVSEGSAERIRLAEEEKKAKIAAQKDTLSTVSGLQQSSNSTLAAAGKAAAITQIAIATPEAIAKAMAAFPPPFNFVMAGLVGAEMARQAAAVSGVALAEGGIVTGPTNALIGDNKSGVEAVIPLEKAGSMGFGGTTVNITVNGGFLGNEADAKEFAEAVDRELFKLKRSGESNL